jgi:dienelactone hydrolase
MLPGAAPLTVEGDLPAAMRAGIDTFLTRETAALAERREAAWPRDFSSAAAYEHSLQLPRERLRRMIGAVDTFVPSTGFEAVLDLSAPQPAAPTSASADVSGGAAGLSITPVRWAVLDGVYGEGLLLRPASKPRGYVIALPDADQTPEMLAGIHDSMPPGATPWARRLAGLGFEVLVPVLIDRSSEFSGNPAVKRLPSQPHREWIYRASFMMGRHVIGYETQKVLAAVECFAKRRGAGAEPIGLIGYGEGGLLALTSAALEPRVAATVVSGYFSPREAVWAEPIYRNVFGLLREFGDAELASLIAPRRLIVEYSPAPTVADLGPNTTPTPGALTTPAFDAVAAEVARANALVRPLADAREIALIAGAENQPVAPGSEKTLQLLAEALGVATSPADHVEKVSEGRASCPQRAGWTPADQSTLDRVPSRSGSAGTPRPTFSGTLLEKQRARQQRQVRELERHTQRLYHASGRARDAVTLDRLDGKAGPPLEILRQNRALFWSEVIGRIDRAGTALNPRSRVILEQPKWVAHEVMLDVLPGVFAWGHLLVPRDLAPGERRPVVVCQHGLEGQPAGVVGKTDAAGVFTPAFGGQLADRGFIVFAPHAPFRGRDAFRLLQRKANPLGLSLFSFIIAQHEASLDWLATLPFVDAERVGFYGISYGGKAAMRVPPVLERYRATVCAADFNDWIAKNVSTETPYSYVFKNEWELPEWNLGHLFNHAELAALIAPRAFMVERGREDPVAPDAWVAAEFARVQLLYRKLGVPGQAEIEFFDGGHRTNGVGSFKFLHRHLDWPEPVATPAFAPVATPSTASAR